MPARHRSRKTTKPDNSVHRKIKQLTQENDAFWHYIHDLAEALDREPGRWPASFHDASQSLLDKLNPLLV